MSCEFEEDLTALLDGELPATRRAQVEQHLGACAACASTAALLGRGVAALSELSHPTLAWAPVLRQRVLARLDPQASGSVWTRWVGALGGRVAWGSASALAAVAAGLLLWVLVRPAPQGMDDYELMQLAANLEWVEDLDILGLEDPADLEIVRRLHELEDLQ